MDEVLLSEAREGDAAAFGKLTEPYRRELQVHCYRLVGSVAEAEDLVQDTLLAAWRGIGSFAGRSSVRTWLYRIATNRSLNALRDRHRRPLPVASPPSIRLPEPSGLCEVPWLEPYPGTAAESEGVVPGPEARVESREAVSLAFVAAVQTLPPRQRAILLLRDVLGYRGAEVAAMLDTTEDAVASGLKRARGALAARRPAGHPPLPDSPAERRVLASFVAAFERCDVSALVGLLTDDAWFTMPPLPEEYQGHDAIARFFTEVGFAHGTRRFRLIATRANGQPAFGRYVRDPHAGIAHAHGLTVLTLDGDRITQFTAFLDTGLFPRFGLPRTLPD
ncbi:sigma-70 family RNA polymerase sigma factor [Amycolatopsis vastitatis]|uniref:RNA polymerase sigma factor n=1 Tax=Amycolatopsis vastitatis TaxID=1905142 RepID=A0A229SQ18_9PSEU|nr:sigma-70 family RNA polymerase sigma factor [Amycolatopsis vastitatis]OXM60913.1 RNA polymerase subunit sigma-70 [Amycolatopsis vastitatis]